MLEYLPLFVILISTVNGGAILFESCKGIEETGKLWNMIIPSCQRPPCVFEKNVTYIVEMDFENYQATSNLSSEVYGIISGITLPWPGFDTEGCKYMTIGSCPFSPSDYVTFAMDIVVSPAYPSVEGRLRWLMRGDDDKAIFCCEVPIQLI